MKKFDRRQQPLLKTAFTMIELVIVIVIMGVMAFTAYKALMGSSDKSKIGSGLIKDEFGQIRLNALDLKESSIHSDFAQLSGAEFISLFPTNYNTTTISNNKGVHDVAGFGFKSPTEYATDFDDAHIGVVTFVSQAMPDCFFYISPAVGESYSRYTVMLDCSKSQSVQVKKVAEAKFKAWVIKNYDNPTVRTDTLFIDSGGYIYAANSDDGSTWGNVSDGLIGATRLVQ